MKIIFTKFNEHLFSILDSESGIINNYPFPNEIKNGASFIHGPFGITWSKNNLYILSFRSVCVFNKRLRFIGLLLNDLPVSTHQILYKNEILWLVNPLTDALIQCKNNHLSYFNLRTYEFTDSHPSKDDIYHFNSIAIKNDKLYTSAHHHKNPSFILQFQYPEMKFLNRTEMGRQIHNIFVDDNEEIYTLDSAGSKCIISSGGKIIPIGVHRLQFMRGMAVTKDYFIIGVFKESTHKQSRAHGNGFIKVISRKTLLLEKEFFIPNSGDLSDIRVLDEFDYSHNIEPFMTQRESNKCMEIKIL